MKFTIPIRLPSLSNLRLHWRRMDKLKRSQKDATAVCLHNVKDTIPPLPLLVVITRIGPARLDDDNLSNACKYVRDQIAKACGVDDGSPLYTWDYKQRIGPYSVEVEITSRV